MDPNECLKIIDRLRRAHCYKLAHWYVRDLKGWLDKGGFAPDYSKYWATAKYLVKHHGFHISLTRQQNKRLDCATSPGAMYEPSSH